MCGAGGCCEMLLRHRRLDTPHLTSLDGHSGGRVVSTPIMKKATSRQPAWLKSSLVLVFSLFSPTCAVAFRGVACSRPATRTSPRDRRNNLDGTFPLMETGSGARYHHRRAPSLLYSSFALTLRGGDSEDKSVTSDETDTSTPSNGSTADDLASTEATTHESNEMKPVDIQQAKPSMAVAVSFSPIKTALAGFAAFYTRQLTARPIFTKSITAGAIFGASDLCAQLIEREETDDQPIVLGRILTSFLVGLLFFGPAANLWYGMVFKYFPSTSLVSTLQKALLGQIFFGPTFTCVFFAAGMIQAGTFTPGAWLSKIKSDLFGIWASGLCYWPLVDFVSYKVIPVQWIPLFVNAASFIWTILLSLVSNKPKEA